MGIKAAKGTPTDINLSALTEVCVRAGSATFTARVDATAYTHIKRCIAADLATVDAVKATCTLTPRGADIVAHRVAARMRQLDAAIARGRGYPTDAAQLCKLGALLETLGACLTCGGINTGNTCCPSPGEAYRPRPGQAMTARQARATPRDQTHNDTLLTTVDNVNSRGYSDSHGNENAHRLLRHQPDHHRR